MTKTLNRGLSFIFAVIMILSSVSVGIYASAVGKVSELKMKSRTANSVSISWTKTQDADGYRVYRYNYDKKKWQGIKNTTALSYTDNNLKAGTRQSYGVRAIEVVDGKYVYGEASNIITVLTLPEAVSSFKSSNVKADSVSLKWSKAGGADGYALYMYNTLTKKYDRIAVTSSTSYTVKNLKSSTSYRFAVRAYVKNGSVVYGAVSYLTVATADLKLAKVENLRLDAFNRKAFRIKWDAVDDATGYQVGIYDTSKRKWVSLGTTAKTQAVITPKDPDKNCLYTVRAYKKVANGYVFGALADSIYAFAKPATPENLQGAENSKSGISLKWNDVVEADGYQVYTYDVVNGKWVYLSSTNKNYYDVTGLSATSHYMYKVRAYKISADKKYYGDFCESVTVSYHSDENDSIYSEEMEKSGVFGYLYDPKGAYFYTSDDPWQRNIGYNSLFDSAAPLSLINFDTMRLRFEYGEKDWMIQVWKGQYGLIFYGAEVGVYTKPKDRTVMHYDCATDAEMLKMSMVFSEYRLGKWFERFTRPYGYYWWCTGFLPGNKFGNFDTINLKLRITAKDYDMLYGIRGALEANNVEYTYQGLDVYFSF